MNIDGESKSSREGEVPSNEPVVIESKYCPVQSVTVFRDRAEVVRSVAFRVSNPGESEIKILNLTESLNPESIRVKGSSDCQILEVSHELTTTHDDKIANETLKEYKAKINLLETQQKLLTQEKQRLDSQRKHVQKYTENILYGPVPAKSEGTGPSRIPVAEATQILEFNMSQMAVFDEKINAVDENYIKLDDDIRILRGEMQKVSTAGKKSELSSTYSVSVLIDTSTNHGDMKIWLTYVVSDATWTPSYDVRVSTADHVMQMTYYAEVIQASGEDWDDCHMFLSTSNPSVGSAPPPLPARTVDWSYNIDRRRQMSNSVNSVHKLLHKKNVRSNSEDDIYSDRQGSFALMDGHIPQQMAMMNDVLPSAASLGGGREDGSALTAGLSGSGEAGATTFTIHRKVNIASDSKPHKVTVTNETFNPQMVHYVAPNVDASAYIQAKVQNSSKFPLLASAKVSVFMDGNFISTSAIKQVSPGEVFNLFLGVDPTLRVEYLPCRTSTKTKGWLGSTECKQYEYCAVLYNTKQTTCKVIVAEVLPRSADEKIAVELCEPSPAALVRPGEAVGTSSDQDVLENFTQQGAGAAVAWPADFVTQNKTTNNIVWLRTIPAGEKSSFRFVYRVLWPQGKTVDIL
jgi:hypothetical protein